MLEIRRSLQRVVKERYTVMIETLIGRKVLGFVSEADVDSGPTVEMILMDGPVPGFGALKVVDPRRPSGRRGILTHGAN